MWHPIGRHNEFSVSQEMATTKVIEGYYRKNVFKSAAANTNAPTSTAVTSTEASTPTKSERAKTGEALSTGELKRYESQ